MTWYKTKHTHIWCYSRERKVDVTKRKKKSRPIYTLLWLVNWRYHWRTYDFKSEQTKTIEMKKFVRLFGHKWLYYRSDANPMRWGGGEYIFTVKMECFRFRINKFNHQTFKRNKKERFQLNT